jgi:hypothetical protein
VRSAAALALLVSVLAGCADERPSALSLAACLRGQGASVSSTTFRHSPAGLRDDWTGVTFVSYARKAAGLRATSRRLVPGESGFLIVARSDADARRIKLDIGPPGSGEVPAIPTRGSVLYTSTPLARHCL